MMPAHALIAEDEPLLAESLKRELAGLWPELQIAVVADGLSAVRSALQNHPEILFLDIRMPGRTGLEVATEVLDDWPSEKLVPLMVFVTAYDEFALAAFERAAIDFVLKPVVTSRLKTTVQRLQQRLQERAPVPVEGELARLLSHLQSLSVDAAVSADRPLDTLQIGVADRIQMVAIEDVLYFEATDKYVNVVTAKSEGLIRISMRELLSRIAPMLFTQVHRAIVVNRRAIVSAHRDELGHMTLSLQGVSRKIPVSRAFAHQFRPM